MKISISAWNAQGFGFSKSGGISDWNNFGNTWKVFIGKYMLNVSASEEINVRLGMLCEAGSPFSGKTAGNWMSNTVSEGTQHSVYYAWNGWCKTTDGEGDDDSGASQLRCSMAAFHLMPANDPSYFWRIEVESVYFNQLEDYLPEGSSSLKNIDSRPVLISKLMNTDNDIVLYVLSVHLLSGAAPRNITLLKTLMNYIEQVLGKPAIIVGDMNINILAQSGENPPKDYYQDVVNALPNDDSNEDWKIIYTDVFTHRGTSSEKSTELDWGLAYGCQAEASIIGGLNNSGKKGISPVPKGVSDHAVLNFLVTL